MEIREIPGKLKAKGIKGTLKYIRKKTGGGQTDGPVYKILLLTGRDSDNTGDQVIEACDIALIRTIMSNLKLEPENYKIISKDASFISPAYLASRDEALLQPARETIMGVDLVLYGGAPMFNYLYQNFYERTAITLELAQEYGKPVLFSAVGVDGYDEENERCQRLKKALNLPCVRQITTRDDFVSLQQFREAEHVRIDRVSDPAVFAAQVFAPYLMTKEPRTTKRIGIFVLRANGFVDNRFDFSKQDAAKLWMDLVGELERRGYDYELLTSGHFGDEAFLDYLIRNDLADTKKCVFNINAPETLVAKIASFDAIISCRLHPSIIAYSLGVPSVGIVWNGKVRGFYQNIGHPERVVETQELSAETLMKKLEESLERGAEQDTAFMDTVYTTLFSGMKEIFCPGQDAPSPYVGEELRRQIGVYGGTSAKEQANKLRRKFRRAYGKYNDLFDLNVRNQEEIQKLKRQLEEARKQEGE